MTISGRADHFENSRSQKSVKPKEAETIPAGSQSVIAEVVLDDGSAPSTLSEDLRENTSWSESSMTRTVPHTLR